MPQRAPPAWHSDMPLPGKLLLSAAALLLLTVAFRFYRNRSSPGGKSPPGERREKRDGDGDGDGGLRRRRRVGEEGRKDGGDTAGNGAGMRREALRGERRCPRGREGEKGGEMGWEAALIPWKAPLGPAGGEREVGWKLGWKLGVKSESKAGMELGGDPGRKAGSEVGNQPGSELGSEVGSKSGSKSGSRLGIKSGNSPGSEPGSKLVTEVGNEWGREPGIELGNQLGSKLGIKSGSKSVIELGIDPGSKMGIEPGILPGSQPGWRGTGAAGGCRSSPQEKEATAAPSSGSSPGVREARTEGDGCAQGAEEDSAGGRASREGGRATVRTLSVTSNLGVLLRASGASSDSSYSFSSVAKIQVEENFIPERRDSDRDSDRDTPPGPGLRGKIYDYFVQSVSESVSRRTALPFVPPGTSQRGCGTWERNGDLGIPDPNASCAAALPLRESPELPSPGGKSTTLGIAESNQLLLPAEGVGVPALGPDLSQVPPDLSQVPPDLSQVSPDLSRMLPDLSQVPPSTSAPGPDPSQLSPDLSQVPPDSSQVPPLASAPDPDLSQVPPDPSQVPPPTSTPGPDPSQAAPPAEVHLGNCLQVLRSARSPRLQDAALQVMSDHLLQVLRSPDIYGHLRAGQRELLVRRRTRGRPRLVVADVPPARPGHQRGRLCYYDEEGDRWCHLSHIPAEVAWRGCAAGAMLNYLFVAPGWEGTARAPRPSRRVLCYDPVGDTWSDICPLRQARPRCRLVALDGHLYAIGGECLATVERYDPRRDRWAFAAPLPRDAFAVAHSAAACGGDIFVTGGTLRSLLLRYDPRGDTWATAPALGDTDGTAELVSAHGFLYRFQLRRGAGNVTDVTVSRRSAGAGLWHRCGSRALPEPSPAGLRCAALGGIVHCLGRNVHLRFLADPVSPRFGAKELRPFPEPHGSLLPAVLLLPEGPAEPRRL